MRRLLSGLLAAVLAVSPALAGGPIPVPGYKPTTYVAPGSTNAGMVGEGSSYVSGNAWVLSQYCGVTPSDGLNRTAPQFVFDNFTGAGAIGALETGSATGAAGSSFTLSADFTVGGHTFDVPFATGLSAVLQPGDEAKTRPVNGAGLVAPGTSYCYRTLLVPPSTSSLYPASRNAQWDNGEMVATGTGTVPSSPLGVTLTSSAATAGAGTSLTFTSGSGPDNGSTATNWGGLKITVPAQISGPCILPNTTVTAITTTSATLSQPVASGGCASGTVFNVFASRTGTSVVTGGYPAADILWTTTAPGKPVLVVGDSKAVGKAMSVTLALSAQANSGQNVLNFNTTAATTGFLFPGMRVASTNNGAIPITTIPANTAIGAITPTTVTLVNAGTGAAANLNAAIASGVNVVFGAERNALGESGAYEKGIGNSLPLVNQSVSSDAMFFLVDQFNASYRAQTYAHGFADVIDALSHNDLSSGRYATLAAFMADKGKLWSQYAAHGMRVIAATSNVETTSSYGLIPGVLPSIAAGGSGYAASSTFSVTLAGGTLSSVSGNPGTATVVSVSTNASGVVTTVNSVVSIGYYSALANVPSSPNTPTGGTGSGLQLTLGQFWGWLDCASQAPVNSYFAAGTGSGNINQGYNDALRNGTAAALAGYSGTVTVVDVAGAGGQQAANDNQCWQTIPAGFSTGIPGVSAAGWPMSLDGVHDVGWGQDVQAAIVAKAVAAGAF